MREIKLSDIARAVGCAGEYQGAVREVTTDSRKAGPGALFVAIRGETMDGNDFALSALERGAEAALVDRDVDGPAGRLLRVPDGRRALISIGGMVRDRFTLPIVGVTGSVGKTTTKEFVYAVLSSRFATHRNEGNQNNELGVPNTLFALTSAHEAAVIEMGMSGLGEIHDLSVAVRPSIGIITSVGMSHIEALGSRENILKAKLELLDGMEEGAPLLLCGDNDLLQTVRDERFRILTYGVDNKRCDIRAGDIVQSGTQTRFRIRSPWGSHAAVLPTVGTHNVLDALAAYGAGCLLGIEPATAAAALSDYRTVGMRQRFVDWRGAVVVEDCYNCAPDSLRAAAGTLASYPCGGRRILALSDMLELGPEAPALHRECGAAVAGLGVDLLLTTGELSRHTAEGARAAGLADCRHYPDKGALADALLALVEPGDVIWLKSSRGMKLEEVVQRLYDSDLTPASEAK